MAIIKTNCGTKVIVDDSLFEILNQFTWHKKDKHICTVFNKKRFFIHRFIIGVLLVKNKNKIVDHINGNPLDNRRANLRITNPSVNSQRSRKKRLNDQVKYIGVLKRPNGRYQVQVSKKYCSTFDTAIEAAKYYDKVVTKKQGIHALTNRRFLLEIVKKLSE